MEKVAMTATIVSAGRQLHVVDAIDGTFRVSGHSLRCTGAQGLIALGWRADAVKLQGRWQSETVTRYTREAALQAPTELAALLVTLCGLAKPVERAPAETEPEPDPPASEDWVLNVRTDHYHLASSIPGKARCGWIYTESGIRGRVPPPWHLVTCKQCVPSLRRTLKARAKASAIVLKRHPDSIDD